MELANVFGIDGSSVILDLKHATLSEVGNQNESM
jgi:hypothetical protein